MVVVVRLFVMQSFRWRSGIIFYVIIFYTTNTLNAIKDYIKIPYESGYNGTDLIRTATP